MSQPNIITTINEGMKPVRFEAVGLVANVLNQVEAGIPSLFPKNGLELTRYIKDTVAGYATTHGFPYISLSVCDGLAEIELEQLTKTNQQNTGPILIDPTVHAPEPILFPDAKALGQQKNTIIQINTDNNDVLLTLYGLNSFDGRAQLEHILRRLQYMDALLQMLATTDMVGTSQLLGAERANAAATLHQIKTVSGQIAALKQSVSKSVETSKPLEPKAVEQQISTLTRSLVQLQGRSTTPLVRQILQTMIEQVKDLPRQFPVLGAALKAQQTLNPTRNADTASTNTPNVIGNNIPKAAQPIQPVKQAIIGDKAQIMTLKTNAPQPLQQTRTVPPVTLQQKATSVPVTAQKTALKTTQTHTTANPKTEMPLAIKGGEARANLSPVKSDAPLSQVSAAVPPVMRTSVLTVPVPNTESFGNQARTLNSTNPRSETPITKPGSVSVPNPPFAKIDTSLLQPSVMVIAPLPSVSPDIVQAVPVAQMQSVTAETKNQSIVQTGVAHKAEPLSILHNSQTIDSTQKSITPQTTQNITADLQTSPRVSETAIQSPPSQSHAKDTIGTKTTQPAAYAVNESLKQDASSEPQRQTATPPVTPPIAANEAIQPQRSVETPAQEMRQQTIQTEVKQEPPAQEYRQASSTSVPHVPQKDDVVKPETPPVITQYRETVRELVERTSQATDAFIANSSKKISGFVNQASQGLSNIVSSIMPSPVFAVAGGAASAFSPSSPPSNAQGNAKTATVKKSTRPQLNLKGCCGQGAACVCC